MDLWYAAYGSNLAAERFGCYIAGGRPAGAKRHYPGCRDRTPPRDDRPLRLPGSLLFGWHSSVWDGGIAFYDSDPPGIDPPSRTGVLARAYRISEQQLADVAAQEMRRPPGADLDLREVMINARHTLGPGRYETLHLVGELESLPVLTFSAADPAAMELNRPSAAYLQTMIIGLRQSHRLDQAELAGYLLGCRGIGDWDRSAITSL